MNLRTNRLIKTSAVMLFGMMIISCTVFGSSPDTKNTPVIETKLELLDGTIPSDNTDDTNTDIAIINKTGHEIEYIELRLVDEKSDTDYEKSDTDGEKLDSDYEYLDLNEKNNLLKKNDTFKFMETRKLNIRISYVDKTNSNKTDSDKKNPSVVLIFKMRDNEKTFIIHDFPVDDTVDAGIYLDEGTAFLHYISTASGEEINTFEEEVKKAAKGQKQDSVQPDANYDDVQDRPSQEDYNDYDPYDEPSYDDQPSYNQHVHNYVYDYGTYQVGACGTGASIQLVCECGDFYFEELPWDDSMHDTDYMELIDHQTFYDEDGFYCGEDFTYRCPVCGYECSFGLE